MKSAPNPSSRTSSLSAATAMRSAIASYIRCSRGSPRAGSSTCLKTSRALHNTRAACVLDTVAAACIITRLGSGTTQSAWTDGSEEKRFVKTEFSTAARVASWISSTAFWYTASNRSGGGGKTAPLYCVCTRISTLSMISLARSRALPLTVAPLSLRSSTVMYSSTLGSGAAIAPNSSRTAVVSSSVSLHDWGISVSFLQPSQTSARLMSLSARRSMVRPVLVLGNVTRLVR